MNRKTVEAALRRLETEGLLVPQGPGRRRLIRLPKRVASPSLRVAILLGESADLRQDYQVELQHELAEAGHHVFFAPLTMLEPGMNLKRITRMVATTEADAWVVIAGSREVLEWFAAREDTGLRVVRASARVADRGCRTGQAAGHGGGHQGLDRPRPPADRPADPPDAALAGAGSCRARLPRRTGGPRDHHPAPTTCRIGRRASMAFMSAWRPCSGSRRRPR